MTRFAVDVGHLRWAPTGDALLFAANVHLGDHAFDETAAKCKAGNFCLVDFDVYPRLILFVYFIQSKREKVSHVWWIASLGLGSSR